MKIRLTKEKWLRIGQNAGWTEDITPDFDAARMRKLMENDVFFSFLFNDMKSRLPNQSDEYILEVIFNSEVLENSIAVDNYLNVEV